MPKFSGTNMSLAYFGPANNVPEQSVLIQRICPPVKYCIVVVEVAGPPLAPTSGLVRSESTKTLGPNLIQSIFGNMFMGFENWKQKKSKQIKKISARAT
jgi:hypothetical protein